MPAWNVLSLPSCPTWPSWVGFADLTRRQLQSVGQLAGVVTRTLPLLGNFQGARKCCRTSWSGLPLRPRPDKASKTFSAGPLAVAWQGHFRDLLRPFAWKSLGFRRPYTRRHFQSVSESAVVVTGLFLAGEFSRLPQMLRNILQRRAFTTASHVLVILPLLSCPALLDLAPMRRHFRSVSESAGVVTALFLAGEFSRFPQFWQSILQHRASKTMSHVLVLPLQSCPALLGLRPCPARRVRHAPCPVLRRAPCVPWMGQGTSRV